jgi:CheY-like chemotaxis protein
MTSRPHVMIVEDNYLLLDALTAVCEQHGVGVVAASSGEAALTLLRQRGAAIDWLLTDISLPGLVDGWSVAQAYRAIHPDRPVIYASAGERRERSPVSRSLFLQKPLRTREIVEIARMMAQTTARAPMEAAG